MYFRIKATLWTWLLFRCYWNFVKTFWWCWDELVCSLQDYTCPRCESGFIEELPEERRYSGICKGQTFSLLRGMWQYWGSIYAVSKLVACLVKLKLMTACHLYNFWFRFQCWLQTSLSWIGLFWLLYVCVTRIDRFCSGLLVSSSENGSRASASSSDQNRPSFEVNASSWSVPVARLSVTADASCRTSALLSNLPVTFPHV